MTDKNKKTGSSAKKSTKAAAPKVGPKVKIIGKPSEIQKKGDAWIVMLPRFGEIGTHRHTYGLLTPYFEALGQGKLLATKCVNPKCPVYHGKGELWLPPRADCPDCNQPMKWEEVKKLEGTVFTYTFVERGGAGLEIECPYYQIDVVLPGVATIVKSYLVNRDQKLKIGDRVRACFRTGKTATNTSLDLYFELV